MATEQHNRLSSSGLTALKNIVGLIPAVVLIAAILNTSSCGSGGLLTPASESGSGGAASSKTNTGSASSTPTPTGALAFVTNFNDAKVSSFTRNTKSGALKLTGKTTAGKSAGPRGVVAAPSGAFLYVANMKDDNIYEFAVSSVDGTLTPLSPAFVSNGNATEPDELAITTSSVSGTLLLWVTNKNKGTVSWYTVNSSTGQINAASQGSIGGFNTPFGITLHPTLAVLYVSDTSTGLIQPMTYNTSTGALTKNFTAVTSTDFPFATAPAGLAIDAAGAALFTADVGNGEVSSFSIDGKGALTPIHAVANSIVGDKPFGVGIGVNNSNEFVYTGNFGGASVSSFLVTSTTTLTTPPTSASPYGGPTGLVVDPQNKFVYAADNLDGTVSQSTINGSCGSNICVGPTVSTGGSGPFGITLAQ
jgi:6-phosphogluconolactonase (cycloisomerase 2 family)